MKAILKVLMVGLAGGLSPGAFTARADLEVSGGVRIHATADFYAPLASSGTWIEAGPYGRCWRPAGVAVAWRPYCNGHWVWTDCGWYWASDEPWGWACYHYGCWVYDPAHAWVWVPGIEWAPAWVTWRVGAALQEPVPTGLSRAGREGKAKDKPALAPAEQTKTAPVPKAPPSEHRQPLANAPPPGLNKRPLPEGPGSAPRPSPAPDKGPGTGHKPSDKKGEGKGYE